MSEFSSLIMSEVASITVTYEPDLCILEEQLRSLSAVGAAIVIDNASSPAAIEAIAGIIPSLPNAHFVRNACNEGLAAAINRGVQFARCMRSGIKAVLILDQDSLFSADSPRLLLDALNVLQRQTGVLCCVGPALFDPTSGMTHGFHYIANGWRWARSRPSELAGPFEVDTLNGSGTMAELALVDKAGDLDKTFFIDHIDTEWSFRVQASGGRLFGVPSVTFVHRMGETGRRIWILGWRVWPERSPSRHYFLFRNALRLLRRAYVPRVWKMWAVLKLLLDFVVTIVTDRRRKEQLREMTRGLRDGWRL